MIMILITTNGSAIITSRIIITRYTRDDFMAQLHQIDLFPLEALNKVKMDINLRPDHMGVGEKHHSMRIDHSDPPMSLDKS